MARQGVGAVFLVGLALGQLWQAVGTTAVGWAVFEAGVTVLLVVAAVSAAMPDAVEATRHGARAC